MGADQILALFGGLALLASALLRGVADLRAARASDPRLLDPGLERAAHVAASLPFDTSSGERARDTIVAAIRGARSEF